MAVVNTGMTRAEMKKILARAKDGPVSCAVGQGENAAVGLLMMHRTKSPKAMEKALKDDFSDVKNLRFGTAHIDVDDNPKLVKFQLNRAVSGMARKLIKTLKGTGYSKVVILMDDGSLVEDFEEEDEEYVPGEDGDDEAGASAPLAAAPPPPPPPSIPPPPPGQPPAGQSPEQVAVVTATLQKVLAALAAKIPAAAGEDLAKKAKLVKLATDANVNIKTGNLVYAKNFIEQLKIALGDTPTAAPVAAAPAPGAATPASTQILASSRKEWTDMQRNIKAEVDKLQSELAKTFQGHDFAGEINAEFKQKVAPLTAQFDDRLLDVLDNLIAANPAERDGLVTQAKGLIKTHLSFAMSDPFIGELDTNPFVKLSIRPMVTSTLANLAKAIH